MAVLSEMKNGMTGRVVAVNGDDRFLNRISSIGIVPGSTIKSVPGLSAFLGMVILCGVLVGCLTGKDNSGGNPKLSEWNGTWNSVVAYLGDVNEVFAGSQAKRAEYEASRTTDFLSCVIDGDTITFYNGKDATGTAETISYTYKGTRTTTTGSDSVTWDAFEGDKAGAHKYLLILPAEDDDGTGPLHFHFLYGSESFDALTAMGFDWLPQVIDRGTSIEVIKKEVAPNLSGWDGTWNSIVAYFDLDGVKDVFTGKDTEKTKYEASRTTDFLSCVIDGDTITFYGGKDAAGTTETISYTYKGTRTTTTVDDSVTWDAFEGDKAGTYQYLLTLPPEDDEGTAPLHFHFLYGSESFEALTAMGFDWLPQLIDKDASLEVIKVEIEGSLTSSDEGEE